MLPCLQRYSRVLGVLARRFRNLIRRLFVGISRVQIPSVDAECRVSVAAVDLQCRLAPQETHATALFAILGSMITVCEMVWLVW